MEISKGAIGIVAAACVAVGASGAYLASRTGEPRPVAAAESVPSPALVSPDPTASPVEQSEALVPETPAPVPAAPTVVSANRPARPVPSTTQTRRQAPTTSPARSSAPSESSNSGAVSEREDAVIAPPVLEPTRISETVAPEPPPARYEELTVPAQSVIGLQIETSVTSESARVEDEVVARVTRDVRIGDRVAIPAGCACAWRGDAGRARRTAT